MKKKKLSKMGKSTDTEEEEEEDAEDDEGIPVFSSYHSKDVTFLCR